VFVESCNQDVWGLTSSKHFLSQIKGFHELNHSFGTKQSTHATGKGSGFTEQLNL
jgi:hypothetical protein